VLVLVFGFESGSKASRTSTKRRMRLCDTLPIRQSFFFRFDRLLVWPEAALNPEPLNLEPLNLEP